MNKKYQVFVSSTFLDLKDERKKVSDVISDNGHIAVGMELFPASTLHQWQMIAELIDTSDYYILIVGFRYGSISPTNLNETDSREISYTQKEYEYAYKKGIPVYTFFLQDSADIPIANREKTEKNKRKLEQFKKQITENGYYFGSWRTIHELSEKVMKALHNGFKDRPMPGWVRSDNFLEVADDYNSNVILKEKLIYYKFLHLSDRSQNDVPIYSKFIKRLDKNIDVFDEYITLRISSFSKLVKRFKTYDSTKGTAVEVNSLLPFIMHLRDTDQSLEDNAQVMQPFITGPSNVYVTSSHYYNGFQQGNRHTAVKADKDADVLRIVVDFSSIKDYQLYITSFPQVFYNYYDHNEKGKFRIRKLGNAQVLQAGIFIVTLKNVKEGEVIRIEF